MVLLWFCPTPFPVTFCNIARGHSAACCRTEGAFFVAFCDIENGYSGLLLAREYGRPVVGEYYQLLSTHLRARGGGFMTMWYSDYSDRVPSRAWGRRIGRYCHGDSIRVPSRAWGRQVVQKHSKSIATPRPPAREGPESPETRACQSASMSRRAKGLLAPKGKKMNIWRLMSYHVPEHTAEYAEWSRYNGIIAIGWGEMGDLRKLSLRNENQIKQLIRTHSNNTPNSCSNGGRSLWRFYQEMQIGDLVILSANGSRKLTMRVTGDYYYMNNGADPSHSYEHRRKAEVVPIDPNLLWQAVNRVAPGEGIYGTLVRCDRSLNEAEVKRLID